MKNRVTIIDLAKAAGVSVSTVDRIMNKRGPVQRATAEHVLSVAQGIGFKGVWCQIVQRRGHPAA
jgi:LacI family transcriptional regulator